MSDLAQNRAFVTTDSWREWCDASFWDNQAPRLSMGFASGDVVFCKIDEVLRCFERLRLTRRRIILVTGEGDLSCDAFRQSFLPSNVAHWFATNVTCAHRRVTNLPLGLGSPSSATTLTAQKLLAARASGSAKNGWLYVNFRPETNPDTRRIPYEHFQEISRSADWVTFDTPAERGDNVQFLHQLARHRFVLCPPGNGVDTHRMWEALIAGAIPVVKRSPVMDPFKELPILLVDDFREVTLELLEEAVKQIAVSSGPHPLMIESYWAGLIRAKQAEIREAGPMTWKEWFNESAKYGLAMVTRRLGFAEIS